MRYDSIVQTYTIYCVLQGARGLYLRACDQVTRELRWRHGCVPMQKDGQSEENIDRPPRLRDQLCYWGSALDN